MKEFETNLIQERNIPLLTAEWSLSADMQYMLVKTDYRKVR